MTTEADQPIRICFIILRAYPIFNPDVKDVIGGAEVDLYLLATELAKDKNFEVSFVVGDYGQEPIEVREGVTVIKSVDVSKNLFLGSWRIWRALRRANAHIYVGKAFSLGTFLQALFCRIHKRKYIYRTSHSNECDGTYITKHPFRGKAVIWAVRTAYKVLTQNHTDAKNLLKTVNISSEVVRNGCRLKPLHKTVRNVILWAGRSGPLKKPYLFLDLARQMPELSFIMICQRNVGDMNYDRLVKEAGKVDNLQFLRRVSYHEIEDYFERAKVFVSTSDSEGFPNTFIQACKCATPILSLNVNPDGFLDKYKCGMCPNGDWELFVEMLKQMLDSDTAGRLGDNGRRYAEENHNVEKIIEKYKDIFSSLISSAI
ncbi:MAG: glycosyltransferase family 4 protein [Planctomycetota bacterium]|jgi:glycosyltransferase involved in cell wall biosynthesis